MPVTHPRIQKAIYTSELLYVFCVALFNVNSINVVKERSANDASYKTGEFFTVKTYLEIP